MGFCNAAKHSLKGLRLRAAQVWSRLAKVRRVAVPSALREPPLILRMMTNGRMLRSAKLLSAGNPGTKTNWNNSSWWRSTRLASVQHGSGDDGQFWREHWATDYAPRS